MVTPNKEITGSSSYTPGGVNTGAVSGIVSNVTNKYGASKPRTRPETEKYPWLDQAYGYGFDKIQQDFSDRGLLNSTNKLRPMSELSSAYAAARAQEERADRGQTLAEKQYETNKDLAYRQDTRTESQRGVDNAMKLWEMLTGENLAKAANEMTAGMDYSYTSPAQPSIFKSIFEQSYLPPLKSSGGPIGDAPVVGETRRPTVSRPLGVDTARGSVIPSYTESGPNYAYRDKRADAEAQLALAQQQAAEQNRIQNAYLALAQEQDKRAAAGATDENDPWAAMAADVASNRVFAQDDISGNERHPTDLFQWFNAAYNVDLEAEIRANNPRALALVRSAYSDPKVAEAVIQRVMNGGSWKKPESAAAVSPNVLAGGGAPTPTKAGPRYSIAADIPEWKKQYTTPYSDGVFSTVTDAEDVTDRLMPTTALYRLADWLFNPSRPKF